VNWFDIMMVAVLVVGVLYGLKIGLIKAIFVTVGVYIGWLLAGQFGPKIGGLFEGTLSNETIVTVLSYAIIIVAALIATSYAFKIVKPLLTIFTLGLASVVDRLGGLALGLLMGLALSGALVIGFARLTYNFDVQMLGDVVPATVSGRIVELDEGVARIDDARESLEEAMTESKLVPIFLDITDALPGDSLGFIPADFKVSLEILRDSIE
jgi:uncharacterized membrane protein required for colicin V production